MQSFTPAKIITSSQQGVHDNLEKTVTKHLQSDSLKPIADYNQAAFDIAYNYWLEKGQPQLILDSACGTGESSRFLARTYPDHLIIGIDQSEKRLAHSDNQQLADNCLLLRSECTDFWRLADQAQWRLALHTLFYPNPYPKPQHLQRRWHGEAAFKSLINISPYIELRTNWKIYAEEFYTALKLAYSIQSPNNKVAFSEYFPKDSITAFERKYQQSGHCLWKVTTKI